MHEKINQNRRSLFKKKDYTKTLKRFVTFCTGYFGYTKKPYLVETQLPGKDIMRIYSHSKNFYIIFHDYSKFKMYHQDEDPDIQYFWLLFYIAHEMRHYYQFRQMYSKHPLEDKDLIEEWKHDNQTWKMPSDDFSLYDFYRQPMELDATLFAYYFIATQYDIVMPVDMIDDNYIKDLEQHYIRLLGETNENIFFNNEINSDE